jgi:hypothetical protein
MRTVLLHDIEDGPYVEIKFSPTQNSIVTLKLGNEIEIPEELL